MSAPTTTRKSLMPYLFDEVEFYPHQVEGIRKLARIPHFILADQMGLGKSLQALTVFAIDVKLGKAKTLLVICPVSLRRNWADEVEKFTTFPYLLLGQEPHPSKLGRYKVLTGKARSQQLKDFLAEDGPRVVICNYEQVVAHGPELNGFDMAVLDEAHMIKNPDSKRTKAAMAVRRGRTALLTGTPILNNVSELWPLLHMVDPVRWPNSRRFLNRYATYGGYENRQITGAKNVKELNEVLAHVMLRRMKSEVLTLPEPKIIQVNVPLHDVQRKLYDEVEDNLMLPDPNGNPQEIANALVKFLRLKQICGSSATVEGYDDYSFKLDRTIEIAGEAMQNGDKVVIFTQFRKIQELICRRLVKAGHGVIGELHGDVPSGDRQGVVKSWTDYPYPAPLVCMIQVAGIGLNMVAARTGIFADKLFVPGLNDQAIDRMHRIGQQSVHPVEIYEIIASGTVEQRIEKILKTKRHTSKEIVEDSVAFQNLYKELMRQGGL